MRKLTSRELVAAVARDITLEELLDAGAPWDVERVKDVVVAVARRHGEVSANDVRDVLEPRLHWLIAPAFNALTGERRVLVNTGRRVPSTSPATKGHGISVYRVAAVRAREVA